MLSILHPKLRFFLVCTILAVSAAALGAETFRNPYRIPTGVEPATSYSVPITATDANHNTQTQVLTVVVTQ